MIYARVDNEPLVANLRCIGIGSRQTEENYSIGMEFARLNYRRITKQEHEKATADNACATCQRLIAAPCDVSNGFPCSTHNSALAFVLLHFCRADKLVWRTLLPWSLTNDSALEELIRNNLCWDWKYLFLKSLYAKCDVSRSWEAGVNLKNLLGNLKLQKKSLTVSKKFTFRKILTKKIKDWGWNFYKDSNHDLQI